MRWISRAFAAFVLSCAPGALAQPTARFPDEDTPGDDGTPDAAESQPAETAPPPPPPAYWPPPQAMRVPPRYDAPTKRSSSWYGWQTLLVDVPALTLLVIGSGQKSAPMVAAGAAAYFSGPPLIHGAHGRGGVAAGSFALRAASLGPTLLVASDCEDEPGRLGPPECVIAWKLFGSLAILTTTFVDALAFAHETRPTPAATGRVAPAITPTRRGATAGVIGRF